MGVRLGFQGAEIHVFPNEAMFEKGAKAKEGAWRWRVKRSGAWVGTVRGW